MNIKIPTSSRHFAPLFLCLSVALFLPGCALFRPSPPPSPIPQPAGYPSVTSADGRIRVSCQYQRPVFPNVGFNTLRVFIENLGSGDVSFKSVMLDDINLPLETPSRASMKAFSSMTLDGAKIPLKYESPAQKLLTWWEFYPSARARPGETISFQMNFRRTPTRMPTMTLFPAKGEPVAFDLPRFRPDAREITAVTFPLDYSRVFVQFESSGAVPEKLWLNNHAISGFSLLKSPEPRTPDMLAVTPPFSIGVGMPIHVRILFSDGVCRQALVRALAGISIQATDMTPDTARELAPIGIERDPAVVCLPVDVFCTDTRKGEKGYSAPDIVEQRAEAWRRNPKQLVGVDYCTAMFPEGWNIYGGMADAVYSKPYRLNWGHNVNRFIEETETAMDSAYLSARPRPFLFIPDAHNIKGRFIEPDELRVLCWLAVARGAKGICYRYWTGTRHLDSGFADHEPLQAAIREVNESLAANRAILSALAPVSEHTLDGKGKGAVSISTPDAGHIKVYTAWSGDQGILLFLRNMNYTTDNQADDSGRNPRFSVQPKRDVKVKMPAPDWFTPGAASNLVSGESVKVNSEEDGALNVEAGLLNAFAMIWLENGK